MSVAVTVWGAICLLTPVFGDLLTSRKAFGLGLDQVLALHGGLLLLGILVILFNRHAEHLAANDPVDE